jgi:isoleucyl-tRNA synthetase
MSRQPLSASYFNMNINFPKAEEAIIKYWREIDAFQTQLKLTQDREHFTFYDGPPFGTCLAPYITEPLWFLGS